MTRKLFLLLAIASLSCVPDAPDGELPTGLSARPDVYSVTLAWDAPTVDEGGALLEDLASYRLYFSPTNPPTGPDAASVETVETQATAPDLTPGTWYFAVTAVDTSGNESVLSEVVTVDVGP